MKTKKIKKPIYLTRIKIINNNKSIDFASNNYKIPLLLNIGLEIDNLASLDFEEYNNKEEKENFNKISTVFEEENSSDENDFNF